MNHLLITTCPNNKLGFYLGSNLCSKSRVMEFETIQKAFERGSLVPIEDIWGETYTTPIQVNLVLKNESKRITFFQTSYSSYPDLEHEYLLYMNGLKVKVYIFWYLEDKFWKVRWDCLGISESMENSINEVLYDVCFAIGFPSKVIKNSPFPIKIRKLIRPAR